MTYRNVFCAALICLLSPLLSATDDQIIQGNWQSSLATIEIYQCGDTLCGKIIDLVEPIYGPDSEHAGQPKRDLENPDPKQHNTPVMGMTIMQNFKLAKKNLWKGGTVYDPENGKTYKCQISLMKDGSLKIRGYIGVPLLGRTSIWTRPGDELAKTSAATSK